MNEDNSGPAFPCHTNPRPGVLSDAPQGITRRDYFAAKAMQGICAHPDTWGKSKEEIVLISYEIAEEMLQAYGPLCPGARQIMLDALEEIANGPSEAFGSESTHVKTARRALAAVKRK